MSGATYRIEIRHEPENELVAYSAYVYRLSDDYLAVVKSGHDLGEALRRAESAIYAMTHADESRVYFMDDNGTRLGLTDDDVHSVKV